MLTLSRLVPLGILVLSALRVSAAEAPKDSPLTQAGSPAVATGQLDDLEFSGVSTVGKKTMINLFDKKDKRNFWVEAGTTSGGIHVVSYDSAHDQITVRAKGTEKLLPLRAPGAVVNAPAVPIPALPSTAPITATGTTASPTPTSTSTPLSQARQEEEARMLVSDLLEIGMAQRKAYEDQRKAAAAGQAGQTPAGQSGQPATSDQTGQPAATGQQAQAPATATPAR